MMSYVYLYPGSKINRLKNNPYAQSKRHELIIFCTEAELFYGFDELRFRSVIQACRGYKCSSMWDKKTYSNVF